MQSYICKIFAEFSCRAKKPVGTGWCRMMRYILHFCTSRIDFKFPITDCLSTLRNTWIKYWPGIFILEGKCKKLIFIFAKKFELYSLASIIIIFLRPSALLDFAIFMGFLLNSQDWPVWTSLMIGLYLIRMAHSDSCTSAKSLNNIIQMIGLIGNIEYLMRTEITKYGAMVILAFHFHLPHTF